MMKVSQTSTSRGPSDWRDLQLVLSLHEQRSTLAAAKLLGVSQSTVSRQLSLLEHRLGVQLFDRRPHGLVTTRDGAALVTRAAAMREQAEAAWVDMRQRAQQPTDPLRVRATDGVGVLLVPFAVAQFNRVHEGVTVEIEVCTADIDTLQAPVDLAVHMHRPDRTTLVSRRVAEWPLQFFAHESFIQRYGPIESLAAAQALPWLGFDRDDQLRALMKRMGVRDHFPRSFAVRTDSNLLRWKALMCGLGIGIAPQWLGEGVPEIRALSLGLQLPSMQVWLSARPGMVRRPHLKALYAAMVQALTQPQAAGRGY